MNLPTVQALIHKRPLLLYLANNLYAIDALIAQKDGGDVKQPVYYIKKSMPSHSICFAEATPLFLGLYGVADD